MTRLYQFSIPEGSFFDGIRNILKEHKHNMVCRFFKPNFKADVVNGYILV